MSERPNKVSIGSVVFLDILDQSSKPDHRQNSDKEFLNRIIDEAIRDIGQDDSVVAEAGDGAAIALFGAPEAALFVALTIRDAIARHNQADDDKLLVRAGISMGPIRVDGDDSGLVSLQGEGVHAAEQVRNLASPSQILVSRAYFDITSGLTDEIDAMFSPLAGQQKVYAVRPLEGKGFVPEATPEPVADALAFSRLLNEENPPRYGLWGSAALAALILLAGGFMLVSNTRHPDLGVVIADAKPRKPVANVHPVAAPLPPSPPVAPRTEEVAPNLQPVDAEPSVAVETSEPVAAESPAKKVVARQPAETKLPETPPAPVDTAATQMEPDPETDIPATASTLDTEAEPEIPAVLHQHKVKKVAAAAPVRKGPVVEERHLPPGKRPKTVWDEFRESFKQGRKEHICTQAEIALNQCQ